MLDTWGKETKGHSNSAGWKPKVSAQMLEVRTESKDILRTKQNLMKVLS